MLVAHAHYSMRICMELIVNQILILCDLYDIKASKRYTFHTVNILIHPSIYLALHVAIHSVTDIKLLFRGNQIIRTDSLENLITGLTHIVIMSKENPNFFVKYRYVASTIKELRNIYVNSNRPTRKSNISKDEATF